MKFQASSLEIWFDKFGMKEQKCPGLIPFDWHLHFKIFQLAFLQKVKAVAATCQWF